MRFDPERTCQTIRIPLRLIDRAYGPDNFDEAGDDLVNALQEVSDYPKQFRCEFAFDSSHVNPEYHALVFSIDGIPEPTYARFLWRLADLGLMDCD
jgi:hypothetical protein